MDRKSTSCVIMGPPISKPGKQKGGSCAAGAAQALQVVDQSKSPSPREGYSIVAAKLHSCSQQGMPNAVLFLFQSCLLVLAYLVT